MGDINTNIRIDELETQLNKKASADDFGMVKIGTGINVNAGVISVTGGGGGGGATVIDIGDGATDLTNETLAEILAAFTSGTPIVFKRTETTEDPAYMLVEYLATYSRETGENYDELQILATTGGTISYDLTDGTVVS